jgi:hypothetical protein
MLALLLDAHPAHRSVEEVVREMTDHPERPASRDAIDNAIRDLACAGLVHRHGQFVFATRAAVRFDELRLGPGQRRPRATLAQSGWGLASTPRARVPARDP